MNLNSMHKRSQLLGILNILVVAITIAYFSLALTILIDHAFTENFGYGLRSIGACFLPILIMIFVSAYTSVFETGRRNLNINLFIIYSLLTLMVLALGNSWQLGSVPLIELLISTLLASILRRTLKPANASQLYACCYGVVSGVLGFVSLFGTSPF